MEPELGNNFIVMSPMSQLNQSITDIIEVVVNHRHLVIKPDSRVMFGRLLEYSEGNVVMGHGGVRIVRDL